MTEEIVTEGDSQGGLDAGDIAEDIVGDGGILLKLVVGALEDRKGEDIVILPLVGKADFAECMVIVTGGSRRHLGALSEGVMRSVRGGGWSFLVEGEESDDWVVVDILRVVVHVFSREARARYDLESLWG